MRTFLRIATLNHSAEHLSPPPGTWPKPDLATMSNRDAIPFQQKRIAKRTYKNHAAGTTLPGEYAFLARGTYGILSKWLDGKSVHVPSR